MDFRNVYNDTGYAAAYADLDWGGTYFLVRRDLPGILERHVTGRRALDFGCGTGRSSRLLAACGFDVVGVDIAEPMIERARQLDSQGRYLFLPDGDLDQLDRNFDLVLAAFPFDNIPNSKKPDVLHSIARRLAPAGRFVNVVSSPEIYSHEWASFSTSEYSANAEARDGDVVRIVTREFARPADDVLCGPDSYRTLYERSGLDGVATYQPLGKAEDGPMWVSETQVAPWTIYVLKRR
jgi:ubiquinone/menaquinone biosynthesis C-methylase UbiE